MSNVALTDIPISSAVTLSLLANQPSPSLPRTPIAKMESVRTSPISIIDTFELQILFTTVLTFLPVT